MFAFCGYQLDGQLFWFLLLPNKVYAYVMDSFQYNVPKMQTKSEMYAKYGLAIFVERNRSTNSGYH